VIPSFSLTSLSLRAFRSVVDEQTITLPTRGIHLIVGPSGAGKSTLAEGVAFALGYSDIAATALQSWSWLTDESMRVSLKIETAKGSMEVTRGRPASILLPGEDKPHTSAKSISEGLVGAFGIGPGFLKALTYRSQKTPGLFLSMGDREKKQFLTELLGLDRFESVIEQSTKKLTALNDDTIRAQARQQTLLEAIPPQPTKSPQVDVDLLQARVVALESEQVLLDKQMQVLKDLDLHLTTKHARDVELIRDDWFPKIVQAQADMDQVPAVDVADVEERLQALRKQVELYKATHRASLVSAEKELAEVVDLVSGLKTIIDRHDGAMSQLAQTGSELKQLKSEICFTCHRSWSGDPNRITAIDRCENDIAIQQKVIAEAIDARAQVETLKGLMAERSAVVTQIRNADPVPVALREQEQELRSCIANAKSIRDVLVANAKGEYHRLQAAADRDINAANVITSEEEKVRQQLGELQIAVSSIGHRVSAAKQAVAAAHKENALAERFYTDALVIRNKAVAAVERARAGVEEAERAVTLESDFCVLVKGFLSYLFDETLARIADLANARLALIPNVGNTTIRFACERETGAGKIRQEITPVVEKDGHVVPARDGLSGGQYSALELAVDLSLADVIAERTGVFPGYLFLDECFEGLDSLAKGACFDLLKAISVDRAVFVVDHSCEMQELFDSRIVVNFDGQKSKYEM